MKLAALLLIVAAALESTARDAVAQAGRNQHLLIPDLASEHDLLMLPHLNPHSCERNCGAQSLQDDAPRRRVLTSLADQGSTGRSVRQAFLPPRWTVENRQFVDRAKPAISGAAETSEFYFVPSSVRKSVCTLVRQLRGPHLSTCA